MALSLNRLQVCRHVKITPPTLDAYEADKRPPKAATLWQLARLYNLDCNDLAEQASEAKAAKARRKFDQGNAATCDHL